MRVGIAGWALHRYFTGQRELKLTIPDFPQLARDVFGLDVVELNNVFFESFDDDYLGQVVGNAKKAGVELLGMAVDKTGNLSSLDDGEREDAIRNAMAYFDHAGKLGLKYFRVNSGGDPTGASPEEQFRRAVDAYRRLAAEGERRGIFIAMENHGGLTADPKMMARMVTMIDHRWFGTLPDFGNFPEPVIRQGIMQIVPWALAVHVKWTRREPGKSGAILAGKRDVPALVKICRQAGFDGALLIEDSGPEWDFAGIHELKGALTAAINTELV